MSEVIVEGHPCPLVLEEDERLDLSPLQLQPATIVIQGKGGLVGVDGCTKRKWASLLQVLGNPAVLGTTGNSLRITGAAVSGRLSVVAFTTVDLAVRVKVSNKKRLSTTGKSFCTDSSTAGACVWVASGVFAAVVASLQLGSAFAIATL